MNENGYIIRWSVTYEGSGSAYSWSAKGIDSENRWHTRDSVSYSQYAYPTLEEAKSGARAALSEYTKYERFKVENREALVL